MLPTPVEGAASAFQITEPAKSVVAVATAVINLRMFSTSAWPGNRAGPFGAVMPVLQLPMLRLLKQFIFFGFIVGGILLIPRMRAEGIEPLAPVLLMGFIGGCIVLIIDLAAKAIRYFRQ